MKRETVKKIFFALLVYNCIQDAQFYEDSVHKYRNHGGFRDIMSVFKTTKENDAQLRAQNVLP